MALVQGSRILCSFLLVLLDSSQADQVCSIPSPDGACGDRTDLLQRRVEVAEMANSDNAFASSSSGSGKGDGFDGKQEALADDVEIKSCGGNAKGAPCRFPMKYKGKTYTECTTAGHDEAWCYTTKKFLWGKRKWGNCNCPPTCGGNAGEAPCSFPMKYKGKKYTECTTVGHDQAWCYTTKSFKWGNCNCPPTCGGNAEGAPCSFPMKYKGKKYTECTTADHDQAWCYTTKGFKWGNCNCPVSGDDEEDEEEEDEDEDEKIGNHGDFSWK